MHPGIWLAIAVVAIAIVAVICIAYKKRKVESVSVERLVGASGVVTCRLDNLGGSVAIRGTEWSARAVSEDTVIEEGKTISVVAIEGVKLICKA